MASICCALERSEEKSSPRYLIDSTYSRPELCSLKGGGCEGFFFLVISINLHFDVLKSRWLEDTQLFKLSISDCRST